MSNFARKMYDALIVGMWHAAGVASFFHKREQIIKK